MNFNDWLEQNIGSTPIPNKPWKGTKKEVIQYWQSLPPGMPIPELKVIPSNHKGSTYSFDGIRVTGSPLFIKAVLSRLKDLLGYESGDKRLAIVYKQQVDSKTEMPIPNSYVLYLQLKERGGD